MKTKFMKRGEYSCNLASELNPLSKFSKNCYNLVIIVPNEEHSTGANDTLKRLLEKCFFVYQTDYTEYECDYNNSPKSFSELGYTNTLLYPEREIHPNKLVDYVNDLDIRETPTLLVTTSTTILRALQVSVREGKCSHESIVIYNEKEGEFKAISINERGFLTQTLPIYSVEIGLITKFND